MLFDGHSDCSTSVNHCKKKERQKNATIPDLSDTFGGAGSTHKPSEPMRDRTTSVETQEYGITVTEHGCIRDTMIPKIPTTKDGNTNKLTNHLKKGW